MEKRSLFALLAGQRRFIYMATACLTAAGIWVAFRLPSAIYPELTFSRVTIVVQGSSLGARQVLFNITRPIEEAISVVPGVTRVQSRSIRGGSETNIDFADKLRRLNLQVETIANGHGWVGTMQQLRDSLEKN